MRIEIVGWINIVCLQSEMSRIVNGKVIVRVGDTYQPKRAAGVVV